MIEFSGQLDERLYRRALRLQMGNGSIVFAVMMIIAAICAAFGGHAISMFGSLFGFVVAAVVLLSPWFVARRGMKTGVMLRSPIHGSADEMQFVVANEYGRSEVPWSKFFRVQTGLDFLMLYISAHQFFILARPYFASDADWESFRALATTNVRITSGGAIWKTAGLWFLITVSVFLVWSFFRH